MSDRGGWSITGPDKGEHHADQPAPPPAPRHHHRPRRPHRGCPRRRVHRGRGGLGPSAPFRSVSVQDPLETGDAIADLRAASVAVSRDRRYLTVSARFEQPTNPTTQNWWFGASLPRPGISWGLNTAPASTEWQHVAEFRADPVMGA